MVVRTRLNVTLYVRVHCLSYYSKVLLHISVEGACFHASFDISRKFQNTYMQHNNNNNNNTHNLSIPCSSQLIIRNNFAFRRFVTYTVKEAPLN